jgi:hypothetical protein
MTRTRSTPTHSLSQIDVKTMTAICAICGPTDIRKHKGKKSPVYICATKKRADDREYRRRHPLTNRWTYPPTAHVLSQIDDENRTAVCSRCGFVKIYVSHVRNSIIRRCSKANIINVRQAQERRKKATLSF